MTKEELTNNLERTIRLKIQFLAEHQGSSDIGSAAVRSFLPAWIEELQNILHHVYQLPDSPPIKDSF